MEGKKHEGLFVTGKKEITLNGSVFFVNELGFVQVQTMAVKAQNDENINILALIASESVEDKNGVKFTYEEILRFKREFAEPLFEAVAEVNSLGAEKN